MSTELVEIAGVSPWMGPSCPRHACFGVKNLNRHDALEQRSSRTMAWWVRWVGLAVGALVLDCGSDSSGTAAGSGPGASTSSSAATSTGAGPTGSTATGSGTSGSAATTTGGGDMTGAGGSTSVGTAGSAGTSTGGSAGAGSGAGGASGGLGGAGGVVRRRRARRAGGKSMPDAGSPDAGNGLDPRLAAPSAA